MINDIGKFAIANFPRRNEEIAARSGPLRSKGREPGLGPARSGPKVVSRATVNLLQFFFTNSVCQIAAPLIGPPDVMLSPPARTRGSWFAQRVPLPGCA